LKTPRKRPSNRSAEEFFLDAHLICSYSFHLFCSINFFEVLIDFFYFLWKRIFNTLINNQLFTSFKTLSEQTIERLAVLICENCKIEPEIANRFCPNCGSKLWTGWDGVILARLFAGVEIIDTRKRKKVHKPAMHRLLRIGKELGFHSITEYPVPDLVQEGRTSLIDVVWKTEEGIEFAFEIRTKTKELDIVTTSKDTAKLQNLSARKKFVVNVSNKTGKAYFNQITEKTNATPEQL